MSKIWFANDIKLTKCLAFIESVQDIFFLFVHCYAVISKLVIVLFKVNSSDIIYDYSKFAIPMMVFNFEEQSKALLNPFKFDVIEFYHN